MYKALIVNGEVEWDFNRTYYALRKLYLLLSIRAAKERQTWSKKTTWTNVGGRKGNEG